MRKAWKHIDLAGGGLQAANVRLVRLLRRRSIAYALLVLFPVGAHRLYLRERRGPWLYLAASVGAALLVFTGHGNLAALVLALQLVAALFDAFWIERRIAAINKAIRKEVFLGHVAAPPPDYKGRTIEAAREQSDDANGNMLSFLPPQAGEGQDGGQSASAPSPTRPASPDAAGLALGGSEQCSSKPHLAPRALRKGGSPGR